MPGPFYQGKLDTFCAIYAVLNALQLIYGIRILRARSILNETLLALARSPESFRAVLEQTTDYHALVDKMLHMQCQRFPLLVQRPFTGTDRPTPAQVWECCQQWLEAEGRRAVIFRFMRHLTPDTPAVNRHWTTAGHIGKDILHLFDCSHEREAIFHIHRKSFVTHADALSRERLLHLEPASIRMLCSAL
jgi:hypothetical protein